MARPRKPSSSAYGRASTENWNVSLSSRARTAKPAKFVPIRRCTNRNVQTIQSMKPRISGIRVVRRADAEKVKAPSREQVHQWGVQVVLAQIGPHVAKRRRLGDVVGKQFIVPETGRAGGLESGCDVKHHEQQKDEAGMSLAKIAGAIQQATDADAYGVQFNCTPRWQDCWSAGIATPA